jgi:hypothetical protein
MKKTITTIIMLTSFLAFGQFKDTWEFKEDKQRHLLNGAAIGFLTAAPIAFINQDNPELMKGFLWGAAIGTTAGVIKETIDYIDYGHFSYQDLGYTALGAVSGALISTGVGYLAKKIQDKDKKLKL